MFPKADAEHEALTRPAAGAADASAGVRKLPHVHFSRAVSAVVRVNSGVEVVEQIVLACLVPLLRRNSRATPTCRDENAVAVACIRFVDKWEWVTRWCCSVVERAVGEGAGGINMK